MMLSRERSKKAALCSMKLRQKSESANTPMAEEDADMAWDAMQAFDMRNEGRRTGLLLQSTQRKTQPPFTLM